MTRPGLLQQLPGLRLGERVTSRLSEPLASPAVLHAIGEPFFRAAGRRPPFERRPLADYKRVLVLRTDEIGDLVLSSAFLRELRANVPKAWITLVVKTSAVGLARHCPHVDEVLPYEGEAPRYWGPPRRLFAALRLARQKLWAREFDLAILPRWNTDYYGASHLAYLSGAPRRVAYTERVSRRKSDANRGFDVLFTDLLTDATPKHEVERNLEVLRYLGGVVNNDALEMWTAPDDLASARAMLQRNGIADTDRVVGLGIGSRWPKKIWPAENYLALASWLRDEHGARIVVVGDKLDAPAGDALVAALGPAGINFAGRTNLGELTEILRRADLFIGNDSGPKHIAAAAGVPVVEISWHPQSGRQTDEYSPISFGPWGTSSRVVQPARALPPCTDTCLAMTSHCITQISVEQVKSAAAELLVART